MIDTPSSSRVQKSFLKYQHVFVFLAPVLFVAGVYLFAPTGSTDPGYWFEF